MNLTKYMLDQINIQRALNHPMGKGDAAIKENILALIVEATEVLNETNWKLWRGNKKSINGDAIVEEMVDLFKFYCNILNELGVFEDEFDKVWQLKTQLVIERHNNETMA